MSVFRFQDLAIRLPDPPADQYSIPACPGWVSSQRKAGNLLRDGRLRNGSQPGDTRKRSASSSGNDQLFS